MTYADKTSNWLGTLQVALQITKSWCEQTHAFHERHDTRSRVLEIVIAAGPQGITFDQLAAEFPAEIRWLVKANLQSLKACCRVIRRQNKFVLSTQEVQHGAGVPPPQISNTPLRNR